VNGCYWANRVLMTSHQASRRFRVRFQKQVTWACSLSQMGFIWINKALFGGAAMPVGETSGNIRQDRDSPCAVLVPCSRPGEDRLGAATLFTGSRYDRNHNITSLSPDSCGASCRTPAPPACVCVSSADARLSWVEALGHHHVRRYLHLWPARQPLLPLPLSAGSVCIQGTP
jgi:hypothetical protein